jgi:acyl-CoA thioester hydrolase
MSEAASFDLPAPHIYRVTVGAADIDAYNHVNNAVYIVWCDHCAWHHSAALGLPLARCLELDRGMAVLRTVISYQRAALQGEALLVATWLLPGASKLCVRRRFQIQRTRDAMTLARADIEYACIQLSSGRPMRWPKEFQQHYRCLPEVVVAASTLAPL